MLDLASLGPAPFVLDFTSWDPTLEAFQSTGQDAVVKAMEVVSLSPRTIALDIEAAGLGAKAFKVRCVTAAWETPNGTQAVLLDPRRPEHAKAVYLLVDWATQVVMHNAAYDWPVLAQYGLVDADTHTSKVWDTLVAARMAYPDPRHPKSLEALATDPELVGMPKSAVPMEVAFRSAGYATAREGWENMDIDQRVYCLGALADTVATLRLGPAIREAVVDHLTHSPYAHVSVSSALARAPQLDRAGALGLLEREQTTNRVMLRTSARGLLVDQDYLGEYRAGHEAALGEARGVLEDAGLDPDSGALGRELLELLQSRGVLPSDWPRTATGGLKADKKTMAGLAGVPGAGELAQAHRRVSDLRKVSGYLEKVQAYASVTGRVHPQVAVLGASATGRMAYREPELQQFSADARPILIPDPGRGWVSLDWSSIEPVVVANAAGDTEFLHGFNTVGADLYAPIVEQAGVTRKVAKVVLLAAMYGQGRRLLASNLGVSEDEAQRIQGRVFAAMPKTRRFLGALRLEADQHGCTVTADGRVLPVPRDPSGRVMGYKATNYFTQGTAASVLSSTICRLERMGLGDAIALVIHDELVVDAQAQGEVQKVMETAPDWLTEFAGRRVVLRTDANPLPGHWAYV